VDRSWLIKKEDRRRHLKTGVLLVHVEQVVIIPRYHRPTERTKRPSHLWVPSTAHVPRQARWGVIAPWCRATSTSCRRVRKPREHRFQSTVRLNRAADTLVRRLHRSSPITIWTSTVADIIRSGADYSSGTRRRSGDERRPRRRG